MRFSMLINNALADGETITLQDSDKSSKGVVPASESSWASMIPMVLIFVVFYFLLIRPQEKKKKQHEALISTVKKGEEVMTTSGVFGRVVDIDNNSNTVELEISKGVEVKILKSAIADIVSRKDKSLDKKDADNKIELKENKEKSKKKANKVG